MPLAESPEATELMAQPGGKAGLIAIYPGNFRREIFNLVPRYHPISKGHCSLQPDWWNVDCPSNPPVSIRWVGAGWTTEWSRYNPLLRSWQSWEERHWGGVEGSQSWENGCESETVEMCNNCDGPTSALKIQKRVGDWGSSRKLLGKTSQ